MRVAIIAIAVCILGFSSCQRLNEHTCVCRSGNGQLVETDTHYGSEDNARDRCEQRETSLNQENLGVDIYTCVIE